MQMQPYIERAKDVARESQIAVQVLLARDNDIYLLPLRPAPVHLSAHISEEEFTDREIRLVGVVGLAGLNAKCAFNEPLETPVVEALAQAFMEYVRVLIAPHIVAQVEAMELERLYALPDLRLN